MKSKRRVKDSLKNDFDWLDPNQKLTHDENQVAAPTLRESLSRGFRSILAIIICIVVPAFWYFDVTPAKIIEKTSEVAGITEEDPNIEVTPGLPVPDQAPVTAPPQSDLNISIVDYAAELNSHGYLEEFSGPAVQAFYEAGIPVNYFVQLDEAGLISEFSFPAIIAFYENGIPTDYLNRVDQAGVLDQLSFPAIVSFYENDVSINYLQSLDRSGFLDDLSFPAVNAFFENGVTIEFLQELKQKNLLDKLSFPAVVNMYENQ